MKQVSVVLATILFLFHVANAQTDGDKTQSTVVQGEMGKTGAQSGEVAKLKQLFAKVLKLYGEGKYKEAIPVAEQVLDITEKTSGIDQDDVARSLFTLAELYQATNEYTKANQLYQRAVEVWDKRQRPVNSEIALTLGRYACLMRKNKRPNDAEKLEVRAYGISVGEAGDKTQSTATPPFKKVKSGKVIGLPQPSYQGISGTVIVRVVIDVSAKVILACAVSGSRRLTQATEQAAYRARFTPTLVNDKPVVITGEIRYNFH